MSTLVSMSSTHGKYREVVSSVPSTHAAETAGAPSPYRESVEVSGSAVSSLGNRIGMNAAHVLGSCYAWSMWTSIGFDGLVRAKAPVVNFLYSLYHVAS